MSDKPKNSKVRHPKSEGPLFPALPTRAELTPLRIEALTKRMDHAQNNWLAFQRESDQARKYAEAYRKRAEDTAALLGVRL